MSTLPLVSIPETWRLERLDRLFQVVNEPARFDDPPVSAFIDGVVTLRSNRPEAIIKSSGQEIGYKHIEVGDLVISGMNAHLGGLGISDSSGKCTPVYTVMRQSRELDSRFISYYLWHAAQSGYIKSLVNAVRYNSADFGPETIKRFMVPVPTIKEQKEIADYLDGETRRIDSLIEAKKRQIDLYLTALDSKKNEIIWDISNARLIPLRYLVKCNQRSLGSETSPDYKFAYCDVGSVNFRTGISADIETFSFADAPSRARRIAQEGNIVFSMVRPYLRAVAKVPPFDRQLVFSTAFAVLEPLEISADYLFEVLTTTRFLAETERWSTGMSYPAINQEELLKIKVPFLDTDLQHDKIANLAIERANFIKLIGKVEDSIQALTEYKTTLIAAAVSGELSRIIGRTIAS